MLAVRRTVKRAGGNVENFYTEQILKNWISLGPYGTGSLPREGDDYTEQLRKMQKNHLGQGGQRVCLIRSAIHFQLNNCNNNNHNK